MRYSKRIFIGSSLLLFLIFVALYGHFFSPYTYDETHLSEKNMAPTWDHIMGTDDLGRDVFTRVCVGLSLSLSIGLLAAVLDVIIGVTWGAISGYFGGKVDRIMMQTADIIYSLPYLLFVILIAALNGPGITSILAAMVLIGWIQMARLTRAQVLAAKELEYVAAARALGLHPRTIVWRHIMPNISGPLLAMMMLTIPHAIFAEAFLSFLGIGIQPPLASLGSMISDSLAAMRYYPWRLFFPAGTITLVILSCNLISEGLRDLFDPKEQTTLTIL